MRRTDPTVAVAFLAVLMPGATASAGADRQPIARPAASERVPFYDRLSQADRKVTLHAYDLLWNATETQSWEATRDDLRSLVASRVVAGPWSPKAVTALVYCWLFAAYVPQLDDDSLSPFELGRFQCWLLAHRSLTRRFLFAVADRDDVADAVAILHELFGHSPDRALRHPDLAAAMAIVFDDVAASAGQRRDTFRWLTSPKVVSAFDVASLPHELARYLVVQRISRDERRWARRRFNIDVNLDNVYHDVEYDRDALTGKRPKQLAGKKYILPNIHDYGGTCGDQTYYTAQIGRTLGYPVATVHRDEPGIINHWWCLQLCRINDEYVWRPAGGRGFGRTIDPATGRVGSDQSLDFLLASLRRGRSRREVAAALTQVALRATEWIQAEVPANGDTLQNLVAPPGQDDQPGVSMQRYYTVQRRLDPLWLAKRALEADPYNANAWAAIGTLAANGRIDPDAYASLLDELAALTRPDTPDVVYFALVEAYANVPPDHQARFLEAAHQAMTAQQIKRSPQLAGHLYLLAGDRFAAEKEYEKALGRYRAAIEVDPDFRPNLIRSLQRALSIAPRTDGGESIEAAAKRLFTRTRDAHFGEEIGRIIESAGLTRRAIEWYRYVFDLSDGDAPGRFDSLRRAIRLLDGLEKTGRAAQWCKELYDLTSHPDDGQRLVRLLRSAGKNAQAARFQKQVAGNERRRQKRVAADAARRAALVR